MKPWVTWTTQTCKKICSESIVQRAFSYKKRNGLSKQKCNHVQEVHVKRGTWVQCDANGERQGKLTRENYFIAQDERRQTEQSLEIVPIIPGNNSSGDYADYVIPEKEDLREELKKILDTPRKQFERGKWPLQAPLQTVKTVLVVCLVRQMSGWRNWKSAQMKTKYGLHWSKTPGDWLAENVFFFLGAVVWQNCVWPQRFYVQKCWGFPTSLFCELGQWNGSEFLRALLQGHLFWPYWSRSNSGKLFFDNSVQCSEDAEKNLCSRTLSDDEKHIERVAFACSTTKQLFAQSDRTSSCTRMEIAWNLGCTSRPTEIWNCTQLDTQSQTISTGKPRQVLSCKLWCENLCF